MNPYSLALGCALVSTVVGCSAPPIRLGDKDVEKRLRLFDPVPGRVSVYACREKIDYDRLARSVVVIDAKPIGGLIANTFTHAVVDPGKHSIRLDVKRPGLLHSLYGGNPMTFDAKGGDVLFFWVGMTGKGLGVMAVDYFDSESTARACVQSGEYAISPPE